jgi:crotonobetainyl-CoA:carnitine CoA-transferase CaiB-like acyl-CoA transferase
LIFAHITGYGREASRTGYDAVIQAEAGFMALNGQPDGPPTKMPVALMDLLAAHQAKEGALVALWQRERTGRGKLVSVSLIEAAVASLANQATGYLDSGHRPQRIGSDHPQIVPYGSVFATRDEQAILLAVGNDAQFQRLCELLNREQLVQDPRFATNPARVQNREALKQLLGEAIARWARDPLLAQLNEASVPAGAIRAVPEALAQPEVQALLLGPTAGKQGIASRAFRLQSAPLPSTLAPPPQQGADTETALQQWLGYSAEAIRAQAHQGAFGG